MSKCENKKCKADQICNPKTGRCVKRTGAIGKKLLAKSKSRSKSVKKSKSRSKSVKKSKSIKKKSKSRRSKSVKKSKSIKKKSKSRRSKSVKKSKSIKKKSKSRRSKSVKKRRSVKKSKSRSSPVYLHVPFKEFEDVKKLGARWNPDKKLWYYEKGHANSAKLNQWLGDVVENPFEILPLTHKARKEYEYLPREGAKCSFAVVICPNNRSSCAWCGGKLSKGDVKMTETYYSHYDSTTTRSYHVDCIFNKFLDQKCIPTDKVLEYNNAITAPYDYYIDRTSPDWKTYDMDPVEIEKYINKLAAVLRPKLAKKCKNYRWNSKLRIYENPPIKASDYLNRDKIYIHVPYSSKDYAKSLGARWEPLAKSWFYMKGNKNNHELNQWYEDAWDNRVREKLAK